MATRRRRRTTVRRTNKARAANPRRRRLRRRRHNPVVARRRTNARRASNPVRRRRRHSRRSNPSGLRIGEIFKDMIYGAGGALSTRVISNAVRGLIPASFAGAAYMEPALQAAVAVLPVHWLGKKFLGQKQADMLMLGGLISAGLAGIDSYFPTLQTQLQGVIRLPVAAQLPVVTPITGSGLGDVYDVDMVRAGFGDVEEVDMNIWG